MIKATTLTLIPAVSYVRMSDAKQEASPDQQRAEIVRLAARHGYQPFREYLDSAISGDATEKRVAFRQMREDARQGKFKAVLCWDQDRFGRFDPIEAGYWIKPFRDAGVKLVTVGQGIVDWDTFTGRLTYFVQQEGKHAYLRDLSRNVCRGMRAAAEARKIVVPCFGYIVQNGLLVPDPATAPIVRRIFALYLEATASLRSVCALLNNDGVPGPGGGPWRITTLRVVLKRRKYVGDYTWGEQHTGKYHVATADGAIERVKGQPAAESAPIRIPGQHEGLVSIADFDHVQAKLAQNKTHAAPFSGGGDYLLSGLMRCGHCDASLIGRKYPGGERERFYQCSAYHLAGRQRCAAHEVWEGPLVNAILRKLQGELLLPAALDAIREEIQRRLEADRVPTQDLDAIRGKVAKLDAQIDKAADAILAAPPSIATTLYARLEKLQQQRREFQAAIQAAERPTVGSNGDGQSEVEEAIAGLWRLRDAIAGARPEDVRELLHQAIVQIDVYWGGANGRGKPVFQRAEMTPRVDPRLVQLVHTGQALW